MNLENYNIAGISKVPYDALKGICTNIFLFNRPKTHDKMDSFIVVDFPNRVYNNIGNGQTNCVIELYVKEKNGAPNMPVISSLQEQIYKRLPINHSLCVIGHPVSQMGGSDGLGFYCLLIYCKVIIK